MLEWLGEIGNQAIVGVIAIPLIAAVGILWRWASRKARRVVRQPLLVFVSTGSTCRDPMAKVFADRLLVNERPRPKVMAVGTGNLSGNHASGAAQHVITEMLGENLLANHRPTRITQDIVDNATLILCMTDNHTSDVLKVFGNARGKTHTLKPYFGGIGGIDDPFQSLGDLSTETLARYRFCANELNAILAANADHLRAALRV